MTIFLLNLDKSVDRLDRMQKLLAGQGLAYRRIQAVYGKDLTQSEVREKVSLWRWRCAQGRAPTPGEIGCALSHLKALRAIVDEGLPYACIMEDDIMLMGDLKARLEEMEKWYREGNQGCVFLFNHDTINGTIRWKYKTDCKGIGPAQDIACSECYCITREDAIKIIKAQTPIASPSDGWRRWSKYYGLKILTSNPPVVTQDWSKGYVSEIAAQSSEYNALQWPKALRAIGKIVDAILARMNSFKRRI